MSVFAQKVSDRQTIQLYCLADDAVHVMNSYKIQKAIVMGMSMGGMLTQMIALRHPQRVAGIVLLASMYFADGAENLPYSSDEVNAFFEQMAKSEPPKDVDGLVEVAIQQWRITNQSKRPHDEDQIRKMNRMDIERSENFDCRMNHSYAQVTGDELGRIAEITVPTLVIHGTEDVVIPYIHGQMLAKTIPDVLLLSLDGAGHELHPLDYDDVIEAICEQFDRSENML